MGSRRFDIIRDEASVVIEDERFLLLVFCDEDAENPALLVAAVDRSSTDSCGSIHRDGSPSPGRQGARAHRRGGRR